MYYVYILYSASINKYYTGSSEDPIRRVVYHNKGKSGNNNAFTKRTSDWKIVFSKSFDTKQKALYFERTIKKKKSRKYTEDLVSLNSYRLEH